MTAVTSFRSSSWQVVGAFISCGSHQVCVGDVWLNMLRCLKAADKNTNERSQVEKCKHSSTNWPDRHLQSVSVERTGGRPLCSAPACHTSFFPFSPPIWQFGSLTTPDDFFSPIPFVSHPLSIAFTFVSSVCPFICHSAEPYFHF